MYQALFPLVVTAIHNASLSELPSELDRRHSLIFDLGFDSLAMARLGLTLEEQFGRPILLDSWLASEPDPSALTVETLCDYVGSVLHADERAAS